MRKNLGFRPATNYPAQKPNEADWPTLTVAFHGLPFAVIVCRVIEWLASHSAVTFPFVTGTLTVHVTGFALVDLTTTFAQ